MPEQLIFNRIKFNKKGTQKLFILKAEKILNLKDSGLASKLNVSRRTIYEWRNERITISQVAAEKISKLANLPMPKNRKIISWRLHLQKAGKIGASAKLAMYGNVGGDEKYRKEKWKDWWVKIGQYKERAEGFQSVIDIKIPKKNELLAEFSGIMLGDGGVNKYDTTVTLSSQEKEYILFVSKMINKLFASVPKIYNIKGAKAVKIVVNRKKLVDFCQDIGLVRGNKIKQQIDIPNWIKENKDFSKACVRGLIDTDGCFYNNSYVVNGKKYPYFKIAFISASKPLISAVAKILRSVGIKVTIDKNFRDIRIVESQYVLKYIEEIGSHNQKHLEKIKKWENSNNMLK
jgi:hypothetical protein